LNFLLTRWHRPKSEHIAIMREVINVTGLVTILGEDKEDPKSIGKKCKEHNIEWIYVNLNGANLPYLQNN
jgi:hypothetical protein